MIWIRTLAVLMFVFGTQVAFGQCQPGYNWSGSFCRADLKPEFYYGAIGASIPQDRYPICGPGRVAVTGDGSYGWTSMSSSGVPKSSNSTTVGGQTYNYLRAGGGPIYAYADLSRCVCIGKTVDETPQTTAYSILPPLSTSSRVFPDTNDVISSQNSSGQSNYGMVAIATDNSSDGRLGNLYSTAKSKCGCPNFNEKAVPVDPSAAPTDPVGVRCVPAVTAGPARVLSDFEPATHDNPAGSLVMNRADEPFLQGQPNVLVTKIALPRSPADQIGLSTYSRRIWTCVQPYRLNITNGNCEYHPEYNACDEGNLATGVPPSVVSPVITGHDKTEAFENAVNKKLNACLNEFGNTGSSVKFDCIDNAIKNYTSFDQLWSSTDDNADGGQPYAIMLMSSSGRPLTGFYRLSGQRCEEYSEFVGDVKPGRLSKAGGTWQITERGYTIPRPTAGMKGVDFLVAKFLGQGKRVPQTPEEKHLCPILVRAAIVVSCPKNPILPAAQRTLEVKDAFGVIQQRRCSVGSSLTIHLRAEQVFEIEGTQPMKIFDTIGENNQMTSLSISQLTAAKYGTACAPGTHYVDGVCVY